MRHRRARPVVDDDGAALIEAYAQFRKPHILRHWLAPGRIHDAIRHHDLIRLQAQSKAVCAFFDRNDVLAGHDLDAALLHLDREVVANVLIEPAQDLIAANDLRHLGTDAREDAGEFDRDIAAADDHDPLRERHHLERLVRGDRMLDAGNVRKLGPGAGGDKNIGGGDTLAADLDRVRIDDTAARLEQGAVLQQVAIDAFEPVDLPILVGDELAPIEAGRAHRPAIGFGILEGIGESRAVDEQLLRHAAADDASAADAAVLANADPRAIGSGAPRRRDAARSRADGEKIEIILRHENSFLGSAT